jgi:hypothetical protein
VKNFRAYLNEHDLALSTAFYLGALFSMAMVEIIIDQVSK